ncbi:hypothetical protein UlMin_044629 [Ulmus minor]
MNHIQGQNFVSIYFTKLKSVWEELSNYRPNCSCGKCTCGGVKLLNSHYQMEHIMSFLMGLHDSFSQIRGQLLLMDPLPPINKVFSLISQEEHQRKVGTQLHSSSDSTSAVAFAVRNNDPKRTRNYRSQKKERPFCTHCQYHGHTIEKCYKLHGYPPGFQPRQRDTHPNSQSAMHHSSNTSYSTTQAVVNQEIGSKKTIGKGDKLEDLYVLDSTALQSQSAAYVNSVSARVWHNRLGHLSFKKLDSLRSHLDLDSTKYNKADPCYIYPLAKQRRLSFVSNNHMAKNPFDLIHCDVWGPYHVSSYLGYKYFLTLVDDCTRFTWLFLLKHKSDVKSVVPRFFAMIETQFNAKIKVFRSDNAPELQFTEFFTTKGVLHQFSCVETPQQNSVV